MIPQKAIIGRTYKRYTKLQKWSHPDLKYSSIKFTNELNPFVMASRGLATWPYSHRENVGHYSQTPFSTFHRPS